MSFYRYYFVTHINKSRISEGLFINKFTKNMLLLGHKLISKFNMKAFGVMNIPFLNAGE